MDIRKHLSPARILTVAFVLSVFLLFFIGSISFKQIRTLNESQAAITRSLHVRVNLERLFSELKDAESAHRGYLLTGDERYLDPYGYSHVSINKYLLSIRNSIDDDPQRKQQFDALYRLINERFRALRDNVIQGKKYSISDPEFRDEMWKGKLVMDRIRMQSNRIIESEERILAQQQARHDDEIVFTPLASTFVVLFSIVIFALTFYTLKDNLRRLRRLNQRLGTINRTFNYAENIGKIAHWQYDPDSGALSVSENRYRLLGLEPGSYEPNLERFLGEVHSSDRKKVAACFDRERNESPMSLQYKVVHADGRIRYIHTISRLLKDGEGRESIVGIDCDITARHKTTVKLEQKNRELRESNGELLSFNHIVSHDLQEPMRKIQMFISRIDEHEVGKLSPSSRTYLDRIRWSASRAQTLIDDLLAYSRLNRGDQKKIAVDLNETLSWAKQDLAQLMEEKQALLIADVLPTVMGIPYQLQQLFVNLLSNSLKYAKDGIRPEINITYRLVSSSEVAVAASKSSKRFHQIRFTDNGIGFEPKYHDRIFKLFNRLHDTEKYSGTGIGLAICRKMVSNHSGFIYAQSEPGVGSTFSVYLPALKPALVK